jgi:hypothetical protein
MLARFLVRAEELQSLVTLPEGLLTRGTDRSLSHLPGSQRR